MKLFLNHRPLLRMNLLDQFFLILLIFFVITFILTILDVDFRNESKVEFVYGEDYNYEVLAPYRIHLNGVPSELDAYLVKGDSYGYYHNLILVKYVQSYGVWHNLIVGKCGHGLTEKQEEMYFIFMTTEIEENETETLLFKDYKKWMVKRGGLGVAEDTIMLDPREVVNGLSGSEKVPWYYKTFKNYLGISDAGWYLIVYGVVVLICVLLGYSKINATIAKFVSLTVGLVYAIYVIYFQGVFLFDNPEPCGVMVMFPLLAMMFCWYGVTMGIMVGRERVN